MGMKTTANTSKRNARRLAILRAGFASGPSAARAARRVLRLRATESYRAARRADDCAWLKQAEAMVARGSLSESSVASLRARLAA